MRLVEDHSPHQSDRRHNAEITAIVLHADVSASADQSIRWLKDPRARASYHYIVERDGTVTRLVPEDRKAWHAGQSALGGVPDVNQYSIGVCFSNLQDGKEPFTPDALDAGIELVSELCVRYDIAPARIVTHAAIATPPGRKRDPGPLFPLEWFRAAVAQHVHPMAVPEE